jgi:hypothetical protein
VRANKPFVLSDEVIDMFMNYTWPKRETTEKHHERAVVRRGRITAHELPEEFLNNCQKTIHVNTVQPLKVWSSRLLLMLFFSAANKQRRQNSRDISQNVL